MIRQSTPDLNRKEKDPKSGSVRLHLGCGLNVVDDWVNVDGSLGVLISKMPGLYRFLRTIFGKRAFLQSRWSSNILFHDLRRTLPFADGSVDVIYTSHTLEHFYRNQQERLLRECFRVLRSGGVIRIVVPDLAYIVDQYLVLKKNAKAGEVAAEKFNSMMCSHPRDGYHGGIIYRLFKQINSFQEHRWMHDAESLGNMLYAVGFKNVCNRNSFDSLIEDIENIERGATHGIESIFVEAQRLP